MPIREALKVLKFLGVVQNIRGSGYVVRQIDIKQVLNNINFLLIDPISGLHELFEVREEIEARQHVWPRSDEHKKICMP